MGIFRAFHAMFEYFVCIYFVHWASGIKQCIQHCIQGILNVECLGNRNIGIAFEMDLRFFPHRTQVKWTVQFLCIHFISLRRLYHLAQCALRFSI